MPFVFSSDFCLRLYFNVINKLDSARNYNFFYTRTSSAFRRRRIIVCIAIAEKE